MIKLTPTQQFIYNKVDDEWKERSAIGGSIDTLYQLSKRGLIESRYEVGTLRHPKARIYFRKKQ